jgi:hypothetical protein
MEQIGKITRIVNEAVIYDGLTVEDADKIEALLKEIEAKQLPIPVVGNCPFEAYAVFCIECDRKGLKPIKYKDYLNLG